MSTSKGKTQTTRPASNGKAAAGSGLTAATGAASTPGAEAAGSKTISADNIESKLAQAILQAAGATTEAADGAGAGNAENGSAAAGSELSPGAEETEAAAAEGVDGNLGTETGAAGEGEGEGEGQGTVQPGAEEPGGGDDLEGNEPEWFQKRIGKLVKQRDELRSEIADLTAKIEAVEKKSGQQPNAPAQGEANPLSGVKTDGELDAKQAEIETLLDAVDNQLVNLRRNPERVARWLQQNKVEIKDADGNEDYTPESMEEFLLRTKHNLDKAARVFIPQRRQHLQAEAHYEAVAGKEFPFLTDRKAPEYAIAQKIMAAYPGFKARPDWQVFVGVHTLGLMAYQKQQEARKAKSNGSGRTAPAIAPRTGTTTVIPGREDPKKLQRDAARTKMLDRKSADPTDYIKANLGQFSSQ